MSAWCGATPPPVNAQALAASTVQCTDLPFGIQGQQSGRHALLHQGQRAPARFRRADGLLEAGTRLFQLDAHAVERLAQGTEFAIRWARK